MKGVECVDYTLWETTRNTAAGSAKADLSLVILYPQLKLEATDCSVHLKLIELPLALARGPGA
jgi:hypothetical protein